jgi:hypothetical protein
MSGYSPVQVFDVNASSGAAQSDVLDLGAQSRQQFAVIYNSMSTGAAVTVMGASTSGGDYSDIAYAQANTSTVAFNTMTIGTAASGNWAVFQAPPFRYIKFETSAVVSGGVSYTVMVK